MKNSSFTKEEHLKKSGLIKTVFDKGIPFKAKFITVYILKRDTCAHLNRAAFIIRKILCDKKSVLRNRFRRVLREAYRKTKHLLPSGHDIIILAVATKKNTKSDTVEKELGYVFKKYCKK
ncbi:MAG: ribonuclease P protein component [Candidatus Omnitrophica bacterium]|nr:ribonuclease P protein component [Candidatus Omnitrophota bacterium]